MRTVMMNTLPWIFIFVISFKRVRVTRRGELWLGTADPGGGSKA